MMDVFNLQLVSFKTKFIKQTLICSEKFFVAGGGGGGAVADSAHTFAYTRLCARTRMINCMNERRRRRRSNAEIWNERQCDACRTDKYEIYSEMVDTYAAM